MSKTLTAAEANRVLLEAKREMARQTQNTVQNVQTVQASENAQQAQNIAQNVSEAASQAQNATVEQTAEQSTTETEFARQAQEIDAYCRTNIQDYSKLGESAQSMIRAVIRNGRAAGVDESFLLSAARISAHSGLNVVFSKEMSFVKANGTYADGAIDLKQNRIIINPEAKTRTGEMILIHELTHAIYNQDGVLTVAEGVETMTETEREKIRKRYSAVVKGLGSSLVISDEINAHFAENTLTNVNILERLLQTKPTLKERILSFFNRSSIDYAQDERLTGAAKKLYKQYKKLFEEFSTRNQGTNATERSNVEQVEVDGTGIRFAQPIDDYPYDEKKVIREYLDAVDQTILEHAELYRANSKNPRQIRDKICDVTPQMAEKIKTEVGVDVTGSTININKNAYNHITNRHGANGVQDNSMSDVKDVARIGYVIQNYDTLSALKDENGKQLFSTGYIDKNNQPAPLVVFSKKINGTYFCGVAAVDSAYKKTVGRNSIYK